MKVFDLDGKEHELESVDAKECVAILNWTFDKPEEAVDMSEMKVAEIKAALTEKGIDYSGVTGKENLLNLLG